MKDPKEPREFSCFDDFDNDGWGNPDREIDENECDIEEEEIENDCDYEEL